MQMISTLKDINRYRHMAGALAKWELKQRFAGTAGGTIWSVVLPLSTILIYWVVFSFGLKIQSPAPDVPYTLWFIVGITPWLAFNEMLISSVTSISSKGNLVSSILFPIEILPLTSMLTAQVSHFVGLFVVIVLMNVYSVGFGIYSLQFFYYFFALLIFSASLCWLFAAVNVFMKDFAQALTLILNLWFWATPIVWPATIFSEKLQHLMLYNPVYYIVHGYRQAFIYHQPFWHDIGPTISFWVITLSLFTFGLSIFTVLKTRFSDVI